LNKLISCATVSFFLFTVSAFAAREVGETARTHLAMTLSGPSTVRSGDRVEVGLTLTNSTKFVIVGTMQASPNHAELSNGFSVRGPNGRQPAETTYALGLEGKGETASNDGALLTSRVSFTLNPGDKLQESSPISDIYSITVPGIYVIQAQRHLNDGSVVKSNEFIVTIIP